MKLILLFLLFLNSCATQENNNTLSQIKYRKHDLISVSIYGEVYQEGTYLLKANTQVKDLIKVAQGYKAKAIKINGQQTLKNNDQYFINSNQILNKINLNNCTKEDLMQVKGIGASLAQKIMEYKKQVKVIESELELLNIKGIKEKKFKKLYPYFKV